MTTIVKRLSVLTLAGFLLVFMISGGRTHAQDGSQATAPAITNLPASQPVIQGTVSGAQEKSAGAAGSYCWPQTDASKPECDVIDDPAPTAPIVVNNNDGILFTLDPAVPGPASLKGILLDDKTADDGVSQVDLSATGGIFTVESLNPGPHRLQITAVYPGDVEGNQPFVTYLFTLSVGGVTPNATIEATPVDAVLPTVEQPTDVVATPVVVEPTVEQPTDVVATPVVVEPTVEAPTAVEPTIEPTVAEPTATQAQPTIEQPTTDTQVVVPPTVAPTIAPTVVPPTAEQPTAQSVNIAPTAAQLVVATPAPATTSSSGGTNVTVPTINVPPASLIVNARTFDPIAYNTCVKGDLGGTVCINRPTNTTIQKVFAAAGDVAQITFGGPRPTSITVMQLSADGTKTIGTQSLQGDNLVLYTLPAANGNFILDIQIVYPEGKVDYFFRLAIGG